MLAINVIDSYIFIWHTFLHISNEITIVITHIVSIAICIIICIDSTITNSITLPTIKATIFHSFNHNFRDMISPRFTHRMIVILERFTINIINVWSTFLVKTISIMVISILNSRYSFWFINRTSKAHIIEHCYRSFRVHIVSHLSNHLNIYFTMTPSIPILRELIFIDREWILWGFICIVEEIAINIHICHDPKTTHIAVFVFQQNRIIVIPRTAYYAISRIDSPVIFYRECSCHKIKFTSDTINFDCQ